MSKYRFLYKLVSIIRGISSGCIQWHITPLQRPEIFVGFFFGKKKMVESTQLLLSRDFILCIII